MIKNKIIVALEGLPGAGKTTIKNELVVGNLSIDRIQQMFPANFSIDKDLTLKDIKVSDYLKTNAIEDSIKEIVLLDRYYLSTLVYEKASDIFYRVINFPDLNREYREAFKLGKLIKPDIIFFIDITPKLSIFRKKQRIGYDKLWTNKIFLNLQRQSYLKYKEIHFINGNDDINHIKLYMSIKIEELYNERFNN